MLLDDRFASLVAAIEEGRRLFVNLQRSLRHLVAVHVPIIGIALLPLLGGPTLLLPIPVVLLELIIDPACSLVLEAEPLAAGEMQRPPRAADAPLFSPRDVVRAAPPAASSASSPRCWCRPSAPPTTGRTRRAGCPRSR